MALQKQSTKLNFAQGLDTKTDPLQVQPGRMLALQNAIFTKGGLLSKRNGFGSLPSLSDPTATTLGTFGGNLISIGNNLNALSQDTSQWINKGPVYPLTLSVGSAVRNIRSQTAADIAIGSNGLACAVYMDSTGSSYQILDPATQQIIVYGTALPATATLPRAFALGSYFILTFLATVGGSPHLQYIAIPVAQPQSPSAATDLSTQISGLAAGYDGYVVNSALYVAVNGSDVGGAIRITRLNSQLQQGSTTVIGTYTSDLMSVTADVAGGSPVIWVTFWDNSDKNGFVTALDQNLASLLSPTQIITNKTIITLTSTANAASVTAFYQTSNVYSYSSTRSDFVSSISCTQAGSVGSASIILRGVGLASKAIYFSKNSTSYLMVAYSGALQPTYFLIDKLGNILAKLAYSNGVGYAANQVLSSINLSGSTLRIAYLIKDLVESVNKSQGAAQTAGIYAQAGVNLATITIQNSSVITSEIGDGLHITGGFLWAHFGAKVEEHGFHLWPEDIVVTTSNAGGLITAQDYYYYAVYEWTDPQGNIHRSAPSIPFKITTSGATSTNTVNIPTLRVTYKVTPNAVRIVLYRWSVAQPIPYKITSTTSPLLNDPTVDSVAYTDTVADSTISGNLVLYTWGGTVENTGAPACSTTTLFKSRLFLVDAEDPNLLWFSKQVIENTPVELSNLFTIFIAPTTASQGTTGPITALAALDDKLIIFKKDAIYYITGNGPDNTGANNDFSDPVFITSVAGCVNQQSLVFTPSGIMFQSSGKGIWILGRDLSTNYIGAPVEAYNSATVQSAINVPGTNQVRFTLNSGVTLMFDYYFNQWGTFNNVPAISSTVYQGLHTYLNSKGQVYQETPGLYVDGASPVLMSFTTAWINIEGLQGYQRAYYFYLLGMYLSPHKLSVAVAYDYNPFPTQMLTIAPDNLNPTYGGDPIYGSGTPYGGGPQSEQWRVFFNHQKCQAFQITVTEIYDPSKGLAPGAGFSLSGLNLVTGVKKGWPRLPATRQIG